MPALPPMLMPMPMLAVAGLVMVTGTVAGVAISAAGTVAISWFALTWAVVSAVPFPFMVALLEKLLPFTVSMNAAPPEFMFEGGSSVMLGMPTAIVGVVEFELIPQ